MEPFWGLQHQRHCYTRPLFVAKIWYRRDVVGCRRLGCANALNKQLFRPFSDIGRHFIVSMLKIEDITEQEPLKNH